MCTRTRRVRTSGPEEVFMFVCLFVFSAVGQCRHTCAWILFAYTAQCTRKYSQHPAFCLLGQQTHSASLSRSIFACFFACHAYLYEIILATVVGDAVRSSGNSTTTSFMGGSSASGRLARWSIGRSRR